MGLPGRTPPWWRDAVVYQVYPASFADSDGDGFGDLGGILQRLDYLGALGVDVLWLSPVYRTPWRDGGYDISDYQDIDPRFGTLAQFDALLAAVHARGMRLVMDLVANHTSDQHPWFLESRSSRNHPRRGWYWWRAPRPGREPGSPGAEPTNWRSEFHQPAWTLDERTGEYYLHLYAPEQPELNWENPQVRHAIYAMMRWWLDRGLDGFRMDVINKISKNPALPDVPTEPASPYGVARAHYVDGPRVHEFLQEMHREALAPYAGRLLTVGETSGTTVEEARRYTDPARSELDMVFTFEHVQVDQGAHKFDVRPLDLVALKAVMARWQAGLADVGWNSLYWCNHDQPRIVSRWGDDGAYRVESATMLATVLHLHRGTPYVYQGEELGMRNAPLAGIEDFLDVEARNFHAAAVAAGADPEAVLPGLRARSRDNARVPMPWDDGPGAGFTQGTPWMRPNPDAGEVNALAAVADPRSVWAHYRRLIELRHRDPVVVDGSFRMLLPEHPTVYAFTRRLGEEELLVLGHFGAGEVAVPLPDAGTWTAAELVLGNYPDRAEAAGDGALPRLRPWEARVYRRRAVAGNSSTGGGGGGVTDRFPPPP
jgi:oligo-1,6-glucosidase